MPAGRRETDVLVCALNQLPARAAAVVREETPFPIGAASLAGADGTLHRSVHVLFDSAYHRGLGARVEGGRSARTARLAVADPRVRLRVQGSTLPACLPAYELAAPRLAMAA
jgi:hypothetical protein